MPQLDFNKTMQLLKKYRIPHTASVLCKKPADAVKAAEKFGFPVVLKISSVDILHKSDINAVKVNLETKEDVKKSFNDIMKSVKKKMPKARIQGIIVQKQKKGKHIIVGVKKTSSSVLQSCSDLEVCLLRYSRMFPSGLLRLKKRQQKR